MTTPVILITGALKVLAGRPLLPSSRQGARLIAKGTLRMVMRTINGGTAMSLPVVRSRNVLKRNALRFAALLVALASFVAAPNAALTQAPQHHDQSCVR